MIKTLFFTVLIASIAIGVNGIPTFAESEKSQKELEAIFGKDLELAKKFHDKDTNEKL